MFSILLYFSGTGNSLSIAKKLAALLGNAKVAPFSDATNHCLTSFQRVSLVYPVYYTHAPNAVVKMVHAFPLHAAQQVSLIATYSASHGYALQDVADTLVLLGVTAQQFKIRMPGNYLLEYGAFPQGLQKHLLKSADEKATHIAAQIMYQCATSPILPNRMAKIGQKNASRKMQSFAELGKQFSYISQCISCGQCARICPVNTIQMAQNKPMWGDHCQQCMACVQWCPQDAISHPRRKSSRKRYHNPNITLQQMGEQGNE